ncbi:hypothetical protein V3851_08335 [Paenibacillus sp. M1]|uniref:Aminoglycoside phosphotransferase domain-containing protein n=1 Tax=Paenibacillus haidiansis TaxID=1574488 RepID=A0ABU7VR25_9BACL
MTLSNDQLLYILRDHGVSDVLNIKRTEPDARSRATLTKIDLCTKHNGVLSLLEKCTKSNGIPYENRIYKYFFTKEVSIPKVMFNEYDEAKGEGILLMVDLSSTHNNIADWKVPIDSGKLANIIEVISQFHAVSWGSEELLVPKHLENVGEYLKHIDYLERDYLEFRRQQTYNLGEDHFRIYEQSLIGLRENAQYHLDRISSYRNITYIHGDLNVCNLLYPTTDHAKPVIIDLEAVKVGLCTDDFVMLFVHDLFHGGEETFRIFDQYYRSLCAKIKNEYTYMQFVEDVRISIMEGIFFPIKLLVHYGIKDEELIWKSINAYNALVKNNIASIHSKLGGFD